MQMSSYSLQTLIEVRNSTSFFTIYNFIETIYNNAINKY